MVICWVSEVETCSTECMDCEENNCDTKDNLDGERDGPEFAIDYEGGENNVRVGNSTADVNRHVCYYRINKIKILNFKYQN